MRRLRVNSVEEVNLTDDNGDEWVAKYQVIGDSIDLLGISEDVEGAVERDTYPDSISEDARTLAEDRAIERAHCDAAAQDDDLRETAEQRRAESRAEDLRERT